MWYYDISPDATRAAIVERDGSTVADVSAPAHTTAETNFADTLAMMAAAPTMLAALRALTDAMATVARPVENWPEYSQALRAIARATQPLTLDYVQDSGHGWIGVDYDMLDRLGIASEITEYSYRGPDRAWLEEDCDAGVLMRALSCAGIEYRIKENHMHAMWIRSLPRWSKA